MPASQHTIAGTTLTMPVKIRRAIHHNAMFSVVADAAQKIIQYSGLQVCRYLPGRAVVNLILTRFIDGDLGRYNEFTICAMVNPPGSDARGPRALQTAAAFMHALPVDDEFSLEAGRTIWGYPKVMADFAIRDGRQFGFDVSIDGQLVAGMEFARGLPVPSSFTARNQTMRTYCHRDGVTRETPFEARMTGVRGRLGGARLRLGDHPYAKELASLGLPKRALATYSVANMQMSFGDAYAVR
ncbi:MAG: acetoacetate decarboxylase family protein [Mycobacteriaceae bacterium]|nr:acetoacetate decarboxylase family protein [Mycobacteriaceae bacterium]